MLKIFHGSELHILSKQVDFYGLRSFVREVFTKAPKEFQLYYYDQEGDKIELTSDDDLAILYRFIAKSEKIFVQQAQQEAIELPELSDEEVTLIEDPEQPAELKPTTKDISPSVQPDVGKIVQEHVNRILPILTEQITNEVRAKITNQESWLKSSNTTIHECVRCDGCQKKPIIGNRYKCAICHDFDFCEECEAKDNHPHPFIKIRRPEQAPKSIMVAIEDDDRPGLEVNGVHFPEEHIPASFTNPKQEQDLKTTATEPEEAPAFIPQKPFEPSEEKILENASHLQDLFMAELVEAILFARNNPTLDKEQIAEKWILEHF